MHANRIVIVRPGGPEILRYEPCDVGGPGPREALIRQTAIGLNFIDIQHRTGRYPLPAYPAPIGMEAAGIVARIRRTAMNSCSGPSALFEVLISGAVRIGIGHAYKLAEAARAQADLQARKTTSTNILVP